MEKVAGFKKSPGNFQSDSVGVEKKQRDFKSQRVNPVGLGSLVPRFDPNAPETFKYEIKKTASKKKELNGVGSSQGTSKQRFYDVDSNLKKIIGGKDRNDTGDNGFSLLKLLGRDDDATEEDAAIEDTDKDLSVHGQPKKAKVVETKSDATKEKVIIGKNLFKEKFHFEINDPRLDADVFFDLDHIKRLKADDDNRRQKMDESFGTCHRTLKKMVKEKERIGSKIKARKVGHFLKKKKTAKNGQMRVKNSNDVKNKQKLKQTIPKQTPKWKGSKDAK